MCGGGCGVHILTHSPRAVYRGQPGCPCLLVNGFYFCTDGHVACCMYCVSSGSLPSPPAPAQPFMPSACAPHFCQVPLLPSCQPPPSPPGSAACLGLRGAGFGTWPPGQAWGGCCTSSEQ